MSATDAIMMARSRIGYYAPRDPQAGSEAGRWAASKLGQSWLRGPSTRIWWCMCFASMCVYENGGSLPGGISYNTDYTKNHAKTVGAWIPASRIRPGDLVIFDWNKRTSATDHVGICEANYPSRGVIQCIEGNTSSGTRGSQSAGNGVWRRTRSYGVVAGGVRVSYKGDSVLKAQRVISRVTGRLIVDGWAGYNTISRAQTLASTPVDGIITGQDRRNKPYLPHVTSIRYDLGGSTFVRALQKRLGVTSDGYAGPYTVKALQKRLGVGIDGVMGTLTVQAWQKALNKGRLF